MKNNKVIKSVTLLTALSLFSKLLGFLRDILMASNYGTSYQADAYNMAITIPNIVFGIVGVGITTTFIPIFSEILMKKNKEYMFNFANNIMTLVSVLTIFLGIVSFTFSDQIVKIIAPNFTGERYLLTVTLTKVSIINIFFMGIVAGFNAILQTLDDFRATAYMSIIINIPIIIYLLLGNTFGVIGLTIITVLGNALQIAIQIPYLIKYKYKFKLNFNIKNEYIGKIIKLLIPVIIGSGVAQINDVVDKMLGSYLPTGSITALNLAQRLNSIIHTVFITAIVTVIFPIMASYVNDNLEKFKGLISKSIIIITIVMLPAILLIIILNKEIITMIFERGEFDANSVSMTATALMFYSIGTIFYGFRDVLSRAFYSLQDSIIPMKNGIIGVLTNIISNIILIKILGIGGLALGTTISAIVTTVLMLKDMRKKVGKFINKEFYKNLIKVIFSSTIMVVELVIFLDVGISNLFILCPIAILTYLVLIYILKVKEVFFIKEIILEKLRKK